MTWTAVSDSTSPTWAAITDTFDAHWPWLIVKTDVEGGVDFIHLVRSLDPTFKVVSFPAATITSRIEVP
jgi:hypothetical protein